MLQGFDARSQTMSADPPIRDPLNLVAWLWVSYSWEMPLNTKGKKKQNESVLKPCFINVIHNILKQAQQVTALMLSPCPGQGQLLTLSPVVMAADVTDPSLCLHTYPLGQCLPSGCLAPKIPTQHQLEKLQSCQHSELALARDKPSCFLDPFPTANRDQAEAGGSSWSGPRAAQKQCKSNSPESLQLPIQDTLALIRKP